MFQMTVYAFQKSHIFFWKTFFDHRKFVRLGGWCSRTDRFLKERPGFEIRDIEQGSYLAMKIMCQKQFVLLFELQYNTLLFLMLSCTNDIRIETSYDEIERHYLTKAMCGKITSSAVCIQIPLPVNKLENKSTCLGRNFKRLCQRCGRSTSQSTGPQT